MEKLGSSDSLFPESACFVLGLCQDHRHHLHAFIGAPLCLWPHVNVLYTLMHCCVYELLYGCACTGGFRNIRVVQKMRTLPGPYWTVQVSAISFCYTQQPPEMAPPPPIWPEPIVPCESVISCCVTNNPKHGGLKQQSFIQS